MAYYCVARGFLAIRDFGVGLSLSGLDPLHYVLNRKLGARLALRGFSCWSVNHIHLQILYHHSSFTKVLQNDCIFLGHIRLTRYLGNRLSLKCLLNLDRLYLRKTVTGQNITDKYVALRKVLRYGRSFG